MKVTTDLSGQDPKLAKPRILETAPKGGPYSATITKCEVTKPPEKDQRIELELRLDDGGFYDIREYLNMEKEAVRWRLDQFLQSIGVITESKRKASWTDSQQVGKKLPVMLFHETDTWTPPGETEPRTTTKARVAAYMPKGTKTVTAQHTGNYEGVSIAASNNGSGDANDEIDLVMHGAAADDENAESQAYLTEKAEAAGLDPEEYETWAELAEELQNAEGQEEAEAEEEEEEPEAEEEAEDDGLDELAVKADDDEDADAIEAIYAAAEEVGIDEDTVNGLDTYAEVVELIRAAGGEEGESESEDEEAPDYSTWTLAQLKAECTEREIDTGTKAEMIAALEEDNATDPFEE